MVAQIENQPPQRPAKFSLGRLLATPGALAAMEEANQNAAGFVARHQAGNWGEVGDNDRQANEQAIIDGERLLSAYTLKSGVKIWVITEADRSATTILLPDEY